MSDGLVIFECPVCRVAITGPLSSLPSDRSVCLEPGEDVVPSSFFHVNKQEYWSTLGNVLVNLADLVGTNCHPDARRLAGCCGLDGLDGPNLVCANGHEIGTEKSDCWMPHAAVLLHSVVWHQLR
jgi:hypothetical protein